MAHVNCLCVFSFFYFSLSRFVQFRMELLEIGQHSHLSSSLHPAHAHMHSGWYGGMGALGASSGLQSGFSSGGLGGGVVPHSQSYHLMVSNHAHFLALSMDCNCLQSYTLHWKFLKCITISMAVGFVCFFFLCNSQSFRSRTNLSKLFVWILFVFFFRFFSTQGAGWGREYPWWSNYDIENL